MKKFLSVLVMFFILALMSIPSCTNIPTEPEKPIVPTPVPINTPEPMRWGFYVTEALPVNSPINIIFCDFKRAKNREVVEIFVDKFRLGFARYNKNTGCYEMYQSGFNTPGRRILRVGQAKTTIDVFLMRGIP